MEFYNYQSPNAQYPGILDCIVQVQYIHTKHFLFLGLPPLSSDEDCIVVAMTYQQLPMPMMMNYWYDSTIIMG